MAAKAVPRQPNAFATETRVIEAEPYYEPAGNEVALFEAASASLLPVLQSGQSLG